MDKKYRYQQETETDWHGIEEKDGYAIYGPDAYGPDGYIGQCEYEDLAQLIVTALNSHDALIAALEGLQKATCLIYCAHEKQKHTKGCNEATAALAQAGEK